MHRRGLAYLLIALLATGAVFEALSPPEASAQQQAGKQKRTDLMQQSDHQRRRDRARQDKLDEKQMASLTLPEERETRVDYWVFAILVGSFVVLAVVQNRRSRRRRERRARRI
jgi:hypothetical protein